MALKALTKELHPSLGTFDGVTLEPKDLKVSPSFNGRVELPDIAKFKRDFLDPKVGQIQPISIWKHPETGQAIILDGVTRWRAALDIVAEGGTFRLQCKYVQCKSEQDAFIFTVKANVRNDPTTADNAHNVAIFHHNFGFPLDDIAGRIYGRFTISNQPDVKWAEEMLAINNLAPEALKALSAGKLKSSAARALAKLSPAKQREKLAELPEGKTITTAAIKRAAAPPPTESIGKLPLDPPRLPKRERKLLCGIIQEWIDMELTPRVLGMTVENAVRTVLGQMLDEIQFGSVEAPGALRR
jgi:hypothetical protein